MVKNFIWRLLQGGKDKEAENSQDLIKCSCCDKMIPANQMELSYKLPDEIASLSDGEKEKRCEGTDDYQSLDGNRFFIKGLIPLPFQDKDDEYCLGVWAEISKESYDEIMLLWNDDCRNMEELILGVIANEIPYTLNSISSQIGIKLQNVGSRPLFYLQDKDCTLYEEQKKGVTQHRIFDYSNYFNRDLYQLTEEDELESHTCGCCEQVTRIYCGCVTNHLGETEGDYWLRIPSGHKGQFTVAIAISRGENKRVAILLGESKDGELTYCLQDKEQSPWDDFGEYGKVCDRDEILGDIYKSHYFDIVDKIAAEDCRLKTHIGR